MNIKGARAASVFFIKKGFVARPVHNQDIKFQMECRLWFITAENGCSTMHYTAAVVH